MYMYMYIYMNNYILLTLDIYYETRFTNVCTPALYTAARLAPHAAHILVKVHLLHYPLLRHHQTRGGAVSA